MIEAPPGMLIPPKPLTTLPAVLLEAPAAGEMFRWLSLALLGIEAFQLVQRLRAKSRSAG